MEASNSCARTLIFGSSSFIAFLCQFLSFYSPFVTFLCFSFLLSFFYLAFLLSSPPPLFFFTFVFASVFWLLWVSSLAFPNLVRTKKLGCCNKDRSNHREKVTWAPYIIFFFCESLHHLIYLNAAMNRINCSKT
jgi:hypothetical protein